MSRRNRETELDLLRVLAMFTVITMHTGAGSAPPPESAFAQSIFSCLRASAAWAVPVFVMISGRFFLDPNRPVTTGKLWRRSIPRLAGAFLFWSAVYQLFYHFVSGMFPTWRYLLAAFLTGSFHMWFLFMIAGLYMITPLLRAIAADRKLSGYFLLLFFAMSFLTGYGVHLPGLGWAAGEILEDAQIHMVLGFSGYYLLGWFLHETVLSRRAEIGLYSLGLLGLLFGGLAPLFLSIPEGQAAEFYSQYLKPNEVLAAAAIFYFFLRRVSALRISERAKKRITALSALCFGIYLDHVLVLELLPLLGWPPLPLNPFLYVPLTALLSFAFGALIAWVLKKIPVLGRFLA